MLHGDYYKTMQDITTLQLDRDFKKIFLLCVFFYITKSFHLFPQSIILIPLAESTVQPLFVWKKILCMHYYVAGLIQMVSQST